MPTTSAQATSPLVDYLELFEALASLGLEVVVIGGCAVAMVARARLVPLAQLGADFRFLAHRLPTAALVSELAARAPDEETRAAVARIAITRGWPV